ncbi:hypothetical protein FRC08_016789 [Ceratobasidium sp. 394]|nr:hypothetical protein FRC08_016789 [Ceratobasidium sp. 394]KAG9095433.1 hypothetical protein FS749_010448 [Ceratobasidium sp. UAMH 11750]
MPEHHFPNFHALIIGVSKYKSPAHLNLDGCIPDVTSVCDYLTKTLKVPEDNIVCLVDEQATRKGILDAFRNHLIFNEKIKPLDPILVYFSGHGDRQKAPPEWYSSDEYLELILPHDAGDWDKAPDPLPGSSEYEPGSGDAGPNSDSYDPNRNYKHGIPDRTLGALIHRLSEAKGDNITVIVDSCYSGSCTRGYIQMRHSHDEDAPPIPPALDADLVQPVAPGQSPSLKTHVLLAACRNDQLAQEIPNQAADESTVPSSSGVFTKALLMALNDCDMATTSYSALMRDVEKNMMAIMFQPKKYLCKMQSPQCEGQNKDRLLFRTQFSLTKGMIQLDHDRRHNNFRIKAGSASGIQQGTELGVYSCNMERTSPPITQLVAIQVNATDSVLCAQDAGSIVEIPENAYVLVTKYTGHSIRILVDDRIMASPLWQDVLNVLKSQPIDIVWSKPGEPSGLVLALSEEGVVVQRQDPSIIQLRPKDIILQPQTASSEFARKLGAMAHFHFHLQRRNPESPLRGLVEMKLIELKTKPGRSWRVKEYVPISDDAEDLFGDSLSDGTVVELRAAPDKRYGLQLTNNSNWPLFVWVLYFDLEDYSISFLYQPPARNTNPPLSTNGKALGVGYGDAGVEPLRVDNNGYSERESGIFMLFVSNTWVEISHLEQESILERPSKDSARNMIGAPVSPASVWDVFVVGVSISQ